MADLDTVDEFFGDESFDQDQDFAGDQAGQPVDHLAEAKRRRIAKACDSCRRKKIRCNGENPCSNCSVYHTDCHFTDAPKKRATPRGAKYIQSLESRLAKMEMLLKQARPDIVLDDAGIDSAILATRPITTPINTSRQGTLSPEFDEPPPPFQRQASQEQDEELVEEMGHLWQEDDQADSHFNGPGAAVTPLVSVQRAVRDLMGDASFDESIKGFRARFTAQERQTATALDGLSEVTERARVEQMLATLPSPTACKEYIDIYFSILQAEFTCINKEQFLASMNPQTWRPKRLNDLSALSTYLMVLAFGSHIKHEDLFVGDKSLDNEGFSLFTQARTFILATHELNRLSFVQACVLITIYLERIGQMQELWVLLGVAVRSAQSIGLHRKLINSATMDPVTIEVRKRCWWILYELDSRLTVMSGNPNAIHDSDCDQDLPTMSQEEIAESGGLTFKNGEPFSYSVASIKLARINHQIHRRLYSIHALHALTQEQTHKIVAEIDIELLEFAETLPDVYKPGEGRETPVPCAPVKKEGHSARESLCSFAQVTNNYLIPSLRLEYLQLVMLLHRRNMKPSNPNSPSPTSATRQQSSSPQSQQLDGSTSEFKLSERLSRAYSSHAIAVQAARTILAELCYRVPMMSPSGVTLFARYSAAAALLLFSSLVRHPSSTSARSDLELLDLMRNVFVEHRARHQSSEGKANRMPTHYGIMTKLMPDILATLAKVSAVAVSRTGTPRQKRAASDDVQVGQADYNQALFVPGAGMQTGETAFDAYSRSLYEMSTARDGQMALPQQVLNTASQMDYFDPTSSGLLNFGWPAAFNPYEQPVMPANSGKPAGLGVHRPSLSMAAGIPALSPGFFFGMAASSSTSSDALMQQQPGMAQAGSRMDGMDGSALVDDYDSQNFWNAFGMYQQ